MKALLLALLFSATVLCLPCEAKARHHAPAPAPAPKVLTVKQRAALIARIKGRAQQIVDLREQDETWLAQSQQEFANEKQLALGLQSKIDAINAQNAALSKKLSHYETAWSVIALVVAALAAFLVFRLVGLVLPWGLIAVGVAFAATYAAAFEAPNFF